MSAATAQKAATPAPKQDAKAPAKKTARAVEGKKPYTAKGRAGKVNIRNFSQVMTHAVDVADPKHPKEPNRQGLIWQFFPSEDKAQSWADKRNEEGYDAKVVPAQEYKA